MIRSFKGVWPSIAPSALVSSDACIIGDVEIGERCSVWPGAVIRGDCSVLTPGLRTKIGKNTHIEDNAVVHATEFIGDNVVIGHGAVVEAMRVGCNVIIGDNATVLTFAEIGDWCIVGAGALVKKGMKVPDGSFVAGVPGQIRTITSKQRAAIEETVAAVAELLDAYGGEPL